MNPTLNQTSRDLFTTKLLLQAASWNTSSLKQVETRPDSHLQTCSEGGVGTGWRWL